MSAVVVGGVGLILFMPQGDYSLNYVDGEGVSQGGGVAAPPRQALPKSHCLLRRSPQRPSPVAANSFRRLLVKSIGHRGMPWRAVERGVACPMEGKSVHRPRLYALQRRVWLVGGADECQHGLQIGSVGHAGA